MSSSFNFKQEFLSLVKANKPSWEVKGLLSSGNDIYTFGSDTKVLSTVFELLCRPFVLTIAKKYGYLVEEAPQTVYPDFTLLKSKEDKSKIAVDVKTTYRKFRADGTVAPFGFTLGSYTSFIRDDTKNILYPYSEYTEDWIIGFIYSRNSSTETDSIFKITDVNKISSPYKDVEFFVQEKYKIAGENPGSGNTTNIGSIKSNNIGDFDEGKGSFSSKGKTAFLNYWKKY